MNYIQLTFTLSPCSADATDLLAAFLCDADCESFVPDGNTLTAYVREDLYNPEAIAEIIADFPMPEVKEITYTETFVEGQDWNEEWEKNYFQPIVVADKCVIHSTFHKNVPDAQYRIVIDPRMAFGTGHHATTSMMLQHLLNHPMRDINVIDMGTGTGILAILAKMLGAANVDGIEIDPDAHANAVDNAQLNHADVRLICGDASALESLAPAHLFLANINRNIILQDIDKYAARILPGGTLVISGFYPVDLPMLREAAEANGLSYLDMMQEGEWCSARFRKN